MKVIIAGGRDFMDYAMLSEKCDNILVNIDNIEIVCGCANGADTLGESYAKNHLYNIKRFPANWKKYGKQAVQYRNKQMSEYADALIAFWNGKSSGTKNMIELAQQRNLSIRIIKYNQ